MKITICAIVVTYYPNEEFAENIHAISQQVQRVVVFDNTPEKCLTLDAIKGVPGVEIFHAGKNEGLGVALNFGLDYASKNQYQWLATFDQDSQPTQGMIAKMLEGFSQYPDQDRVRILAPRHLNPPFKVDIDPGLNSAIQRRAVITSGNLIKIAGLDLHHRFDDDLFIDSVDHDFCLKTLQRHQLILEFDSAILMHHLGDITLHHKIGVQMHATNHAPIRHYYMLRNRLVIWRRYGMNFPAWVLGDIYAHLKMVARVMLLEENKLEKMRYMGKGFLDFLKGKKGIFGE